MTFSIRDYRFQYFNHVNDGSLQCVIGTRSRELTVSTDNSECTHKGQAGGCGLVLCESFHVYLRKCILQSVSLRCLHAFPAGFVARTEGDGNCFGTFP